MRKRIQKRKCLRELAAFVPLQDVRVDRSLVLFHRIIKFLTSLGIVLPQIHRYVRYAMHESTAARAMCRLHLVARLPVVERV